MKFCILHRCPLGRPLSFTAVVLMLVFSADGGLPFTPAATAAPPDAVASLPVAAPARSIATTGSPVTRVPSLGIGPGIARTREVNVQETPEGVQRLLMQLVQDNIPEKYEQDKDWGRQKKVWAGVHLKLDGLDLHTKRKWKEVNHGTWKRYAVELVKPEEFLKVRLENVHEPEAGQLAFQLILSAKLNPTGRVQRWNRGIRVWSISADAIVRMELRLACRMGTQLDARKFPPDILLQPVVDSAQLALVNFRLRRISHADGPIVREVGDGLESVVRKQMKKREEKLTSKINRQIEKHRDDLRLSLADWLANKQPDSPPETPPKTAAKK